MADNFVENAKNHSFCTLAHASAKRCRLCASSARRARIKKPSPPEGNNESLGFACCEPCWAHTENTWAARSPSLRHVERICPIARWRVSVHLQKWELGAKLRRCEVGSPCMALGEHWVLPARHTTMMVLDGALPVFRDSEISRQQIGLETLGSSENREYKRLVICPDDASCTAPWPSNSASWPPSIPLRFPPGYSNPQLHGRWSDPPRDHAGGRRAMRHWVCLGSGSAGRTRQPKGRKHSGPKTTVGKGERCPAGGQRARTTMLSAECWRPPAAGAP